MNERRLTVKQMIARLRKFPPHAFVAWQNHDQNEDEIDGYVGCLNDASSKLLFRRSDERDGHPIVVLSP